MKKESKGDLKKKLIIKTALKLFAKNGFQDVSFQQIADAAKMKQTALIYHFNNKNALLFAIIESSTVNFNKSVSGLSSPSDNSYVRLLNHLRANIDWADNYPYDVKLIIALFYNACINKTMATFYKTITNESRTRYQEYVCSGIKEGIFKVNPKKANMIANVIHELLIGSIINYVTLKDISKRALMKKLELSIRSLLVISD